MLRLISGLFLTFTVIAPIADVELENIFDPVLDFSVQGSAFAADGKSFSSDQLRSIIKKQCEAYIVDKARSCNTQLEVAVKLTQDDLPVPCGVQLCGHIAPYTRQMLQQWLHDEMGIPKESQVWIG